jgi:hypothetical protein
MLVEINDAQYTIDAVDGDLVTIDRPLETDLASGARIPKVITFTPFESSAYNAQQHALYLGDSELLNLEAAATIEVVGASVLSAGYNWEFWGKGIEGDDEEKWRAMAIDTTAQKTDAVVLKKSRGEVAEKKINGKKARWIRAYRKTVGATENPFTKDEIRLRINPTGCEAAPCAPPAGTESPAAEAMANTTPLVVSEEFAPLGREPRQFDAFYLGSKEAFSKTGAKVQLCFEMADASFSVLSALRTGTNADKILAGVAADKRLHVLSFDNTSGLLSNYLGREPMRPPSPGPLGVASTNPPVDLDPRPTFRIPIWTSPIGFSVGVTANEAVWVWDEVNIATQSGWRLLGTVGPVLNSDSPIQGLVHLGDGAEGFMFALRESKLFVRDLNDPDGTWETLTTEDSGASVALANIAPIYIEGATIGAGTVAEGLVGISDDDKLYGVEIDLAALSAECTKLLNDVTADVAPAAVRRTDATLVAVAIGNDPDPNDRKVLSFQSTAAAESFSHQDDDEADVEWPTIVGNAIDVNITGGQLTFVFCAQRNEQAIGLHSWNPFDSTNPVTLLRTKISPQVGIANGAPTLLPAHVIVPISSSEVIVAEFDPADRRTFKTKLRTAVIATEPEERLSAGDMLAIPVDGGPPDYQLETAPAGVDHRGQTLYEFNVESVDDAFFVYRAAASPFTAEVDADDLEFVTLPDTDTQTDIGSLLLITTDLPSTELYRVDGFDPNTHIAELDRELNVLDPTAPPPDVSYQVPETTSAQLLPMLHLDPLNTGLWDANVLNRVPLVFAGADPEAQTAVAFKTDAQRHPELVALTRYWTTAPTPDGAGAVEFMVDGSVGDWSVQLGDTSTNPELSWEYWNGTGWWKLDPVDDKTGDLKRTGLITFTVPSDLRPTDWSGRTNHWIRARLVGGDYGREKVTIRSEPDGTATVQTVERSLEGISPPLVLKLTIFYGVCGRGARPRFVQAEDGGTFRDQSDANRTAGAIVEAFVPLAVTLGRLSKNLVPTGPVDECPPECACGDTHSGTESGTAASRALSASTTRETGRSIFVGVNATLSESPVNILFLVDEKDHARLAPLAVEALIGDQFVSIIVDDKTRALGESGLLSMTFTRRPTPSELFGKTLTWLRLKPQPSADGKWLPTLSGAYLNAVWASATETLTRELLGSSSGEPHLTVRLARPPVLYKTLELRVKEPLGEEEREELRKDGENKVLSDVEGLSDGDWVLWDQVLDPGDAEPSDRVYSLDENNGEIRFGDGVHGKIPPTGPDAIVAFRYSRTERDPAGGDRVPANGIKPRTELNLVSPVESVETVIAADESAGGAPTESDERVLRFGFARIRHRNRAVTADDIEDLALQSSPDIVQARAFVRRDHIRLIVVMRGKAPRPNAAQIRELHRQLLLVAPVSLSASGALRIERPVIRKLRIDLKLRVATLKEAGALTDFVKQRLTEFFDTAIGGVDNDGWALGLSPTEGDIALALIDAPHLESIKDVKLREIETSGRVIPELEPLRPNELVMLADDPVRIEFETAEVAL